MHIATIILGVVFLFLLVELAVHRRTRIISLDRRFYDQHGDKQRIVLSVFGYEVWYRSTNLLPYREYTFCMWRFRLSFCTYPVGPCDDGDGNMVSMKPWFGCSLFKDMSDICTVQDAYIIMHLCAGINTAFAVALELHPTTSYAFERDLVRTTHVFDTYEPEEEEEEEEEEEVTKTASPDNGFDPDAFAFTVTVLCCAAVLAVVFWCMHADITH